MNKVEEEWWPYGIYRFKGVCILVPCAYILWLFKRRGGRKSEEKSSNMPSNISNGFGVHSIFDCFFKALLVVVVVLIWNLFSNSKSTCIRKEWWVDSEFCVPNYKTFKYLRNWTSHKLSDFTKTPVPSRLVCCIEIEICLKQAQTRDVTVPRFRFAICSVGFFYESSTGHFQLLMFNTTSKIVLDEFWSREHITELLNNYTVPKFAIV
jgi:hypothetical protein